MRQATWIIKLCLIPVLMLPLSAQTGNGIVRGTVLDASRATIPAASVTLTNTATGIVRSAQTSAVGIYYFGSVPIGPYTLSVEAAGFKKWSGTLNVAAGETVVIDPNMEVGTVESVVEVTGAAPVITTEGMEVGDVKDELRIRQLPLNGRVVSNLFDLTPGVEGGSNPRVNGMKVGSADMLLDGISLTDRYGGGMSRVQPGLDTIQEYRIETAGSSAQYARPATMSLVTKSGTNELHGSVFWTHRNNFGGLRARQRQDFYDQPPQYIRNEFGASAGGPVIKNKTFWFAAYEGQRERQSRFARTSAPTAAIWDGDFSGAITSNSEPITIYNPYSTGADGTRVPFSSNRIPKNMITPFAETMRSISATPTGPNAGGNPWLEDNFEAYYPQQSDIGTITLKGDHVFSESDNLSGRFTRSTRAYKLFGGRYGYPVPGSTDAGGTGRSDSSVHTMFARWNHVFSPTLLNEFQASAYRSWHSQGTLGDDTDWANKLGFPNPFGVTGWPTICSDSDFFYWGCWDGDNRGLMGLTAYQLENNVTWIKGTHSVKFGFKGRQEYNNTNWLQQAQGSHHFGDDWTALYDPVGDQAVSRTGSGFASVLLGLPTYLSNQYNRGYYYFQQKEMGLYVQDSWKVHPRVSLELGLRWDKWTVYKEKYDRLVNIDIVNYANKFEVITPRDVRMEDIPEIPPSVLASWAARGLTWTTAREAGFPDSLLPADNNNFAPRLGAAIRLTDKWVLRSGYGVYYWTMPLSQILDSQRSNPPMNLRFTNEIGSKNGADFRYALTNVPADDDKMGNVRVDTEGIVPISSTARAGMAFDKDTWKENMMQEWTFTIERELMKETAVKLSYIGNRGSGLEQRWRWNDPESEWNYQARTGQIRPSDTDVRRVNPDWTSGCCNAPIKHNGFSNAHTGQIEVERRYSDGLAFQWFYSYTHAMTTNDTGGFSYGSSNINATGSQQMAVPETQVLFGNPSMTEEQRLRLAYYNAATIPAHRIRWNGIYDLPFGRGKKFGNNAGRGLDAIIGGWQIAFIGSWRSGMWSSVSGGSYLFGDPTLNANERLEMNIFGRTQRLWFRGDFDPTLASGVDQTKLQQLVPLDRSQRVLRPVGSNFDNRIPQVLADDTVRDTPVTDMVNWNARNFWRGPGDWGQDISVFKTFQITERLRTRFTADFFNAFNHPLDVNPNSTTGLQDLSTQSNDPRIIQLSLRVEW
jgi:hypothetical protein